MTTEANARAHKRLFTWVLAVACAQALAIFVYLHVEKSRQETARSAAFTYERLSGRTAPNLSLTSLDGRPRSLVELRGKAVLLHFWATWCEPCKKELPQLLQLGRDLARNGELELIAVALDDGPDEVRSFFAGNVPAEIYRDLTGEAAKLYEVSTLPDTYLLDATGAPRLRFAGAREWSAAPARALLHQQLAQADR